MWGTVDIGDRVIGTGWLTDRPDVRDRTTERPSVQQLLAQTGEPTVGTEQLPTAVDLREWCSPIEDQGSLGSCTAQAGSALVEYYERRALGHHLDASRLFLYKVTRQLMGVTGDTGAYLRTTMAALALFGAPPEKYWPYQIAEFEAEPTPFVFGLADNFEALEYYRLDPATSTQTDTLARIRSHLASGLPAMFGFPVYASIAQAATSGEIPFPGDDDSMQGGHAVVAVGYDDSRPIGGSAGTTATTGALLIRNSWGTDWGDHGYGWLPYDYVLQGGATDWWTMLRAGWVETDHFGL